MNDVAIIGIGLHPFGRFGDKTPFQMAADAVEEALADAGITWSDVQFAVGGSWEAAQLDPITGLLGLTGIPFTNVFNACATAASTIDQAAAAIRLGRFDIGVAVGADKHPRGPSRLTRRAWACRSGTARTASTSPRSSSA